MECRLLGGEAFGELVCQKTVQGNVDGALTGPASAPLPLLLVHASEQRLYSSGMF